MNDDTIEARVTRYLTRHTEWLRERLDELANFSGEGDGPTPESIAAAQARHERELEHLGREQSGLLREWTEAPLNEEERAAVRALAAEASDLSDQLRTAYAAAVLRLQAEMKQVREEQDRLQMGRGALRKYGHSPSDDASHIDRHA